MVLNLISVSPECATKQTAQTRRSNCNARVTRVTAFFAQHNPTRRRHPAPNTVVHPSQPAHHPPAPRKHQNPPVDVSGRFCGVKRLRARAQRRPLFRLCLPRGAGRSQSPAAAAQQAARNNSSSGRRSSCRHMLASAAAGCMGPYSCLSRAAAVAGRRGVAMFVLRAAETTFRDLLPHPDDSAAGGDRQHKHVSQVRATGWRLSCGAAVGCAARRMCERTWPSITPSMLTHPAATRARARQPTSAPRRPRSRGASSGRRCPWTAQRRWQQPCRSPATRCVVLGCRRAPEFVLSCVVCKVVVGGGGCSRRPGRQPADRLPTHSHSTHTPTAHRRASSRRLRPPTAWCLQTLRGSGCVAGARARSWGARAWGSCRGPRQTA
jgi:hypothetical protein